MNFKCFRMRNACSNIPGRLHCGPAILLASILIAGGCATRPASDTLEPVAISSPGTQQRTILTSTNRKLNENSENKPDRRSDSLTFEQYSFSIPAKRKVNDIVYPTRKIDPERQYFVTQRKALSEVAFIENVNAQTNDDGTLCVFIHGYNYTYQEALFRTAQLAADAGELSPPVLFSWPSTASVSGYVADRDAALASRTELAALLETVNKAPKVKHVVIFAHSMGAMLAVEAVRQLKFEGRDDLLNRMEIVLAAADIDVDLFESQLRDIGPLPIPITLLVSKEDKALVASSLLGSKRPRVGQISAAAPLTKRAARADLVRIVDITSLQDPNPLGHNRYGSLAQLMGQAAEQDWQQQMPAANYIGTLLLNPSTPRSKTLTNLSRPVAAKPFAATPVSR